MRTRNKVVKTRNKRAPKQCFKQPIIKRLMEISLRIEGYIYNGKTIDTPEAQRYLSEVQPFLETCKSDERILQVTNKIIRQMRKLIDQNKADIAIETNEELVTLTQNLSISNNNDDKEKEEVSQSILQTEPVSQTIDNSNRNEVSRDWDREFDPKKGVDLHNTVAMNISNIFGNSKSILYLRSNSKDTPIITISDDSSSEEICPKENLINLTQESDVSQSILKDYDPGVPEAFNTKVNPERNKKTNNINIKNTNNVELPNIPNIYRNAVKLIDINKLTYKTQTPVNIECVKLTNKPVNKKTVVKEANVSRTNYNNVNPITQNLLSKPQSNHKSNKKASVIKPIKKNNDKIRNKRKTNCTNENNMTVKTRKSRSKSDKNDILGRSQQKPKRRKYNRKENEFSWLKCIKYVREINSDEYIDAVVPDNFWTDYSPFPQFTEEDFSVPII